MMKEILERLTAIEERLDTVLEFMENEFTDSNDLVEDDSSEVEEEEYEFDKKDLSIVSLRHYGYKLSLPDNERYQVIERLCTIAKTNPRKFSVEEVYRHLLALHYLWSSREDYPEYTEALDKDIEYIQSYL
jgi:hypothetical protein